MKFLIIGDSWGVGEWRLTNDTRGCVSIPNTGLDFYLKKFGHTVNNLSYGGEGNFGQLRYACHKLMTENSDYDYIIWFHTEPVRDIVQFVLNQVEAGQQQYPNIQGKSFVDAMQYVNLCNYQYAQREIFERFDIPFIVIGGVGKLDHTIDNFAFAQIKIYSWLKELLALDSVPHNFLKYDGVDAVYDYLKPNGIEQVLTEIERGEALQDLTKDHVNFPDGMHPRRTEFEKLANRILNMLK